MKTKILNLIELEIDALMEDYQHQINTLKSENKHLQKEVRILKEERLKPVVSEINSLEILLTTCKDLVLKGQLEAVDYILESILDFTDHIEKISAKELEVFHETILKLLHSKDSSEINEFLLDSILDMLILLSRSKYKQNTAIFLKQNFSDLFQYSCVPNLPTLITKNLRVYLHYDLFTELKEVYTYLLKIEFSFIDYSLEKSEFIFLFWYAFLMDLDKEFLEQCDYSKRWWSVENLEICLYLYAKNPQESNLLYHDMQTILSNSPIFENYEKKLIFKKVDSLINHSIDVPKEKQVIIHDIYLINDSDINLAKDRLLLIEKKIYIPLYRSKNVNISKKNVPIIALVNQKHSKAYIQHTDYLSLLKTYEPLQPKANKHYLNFKWPSTEISRNDSSTKENKVLKENSDLKQMGYQITAMSREARWEILQKAVPKLGVKKIAYTIAYNVRLRKGQTNGLQKYEHAISEWEHDLQKLKIQYYDHNFVWPNT